ncbi:hypothetical protein AU375_04448 [Methylobacterium radiotolerans]|nr:hypothetical protein AU375_04448 [Methylobacterium radiotolerans]
MSDEKPDPVPPFPMDDDRSVGFHVAMGTLDAAASLVPGASYGVQQLVRQFIGEPLERRREAWFTSLGLGVRELQDRFEGFDPDRLAENEEFVSTVAETTRIAMATHRAEKLEALRNVVLNVAAGVHLDQVLQGTFLGYVDRFSGLHLKVLKMLSNPAAIPAMVARAENSMTGSLSILFEAALPELGSNNPLLARVIADLSQERLTNGATLNGMMTGSGLLEKRTSEFGDSFLKFISSPLE